MPKFRKRPVVIEAEQLTWDNWHAVCELLGPFNDGCKGVMFDDAGNEVSQTEGFDGAPSWAPIPHIGLIIPTLEGNHLARENDWIIKGVAGEFYPCKPDIFEATYEAV
jgi:hypothetical protein